MNDYTYQNKLINKKQLKELGPFKLCIFHRSALQQFGFRKTP